MTPFAKRMAYMQSTADVVRYLFESMTDPETISFGGGAPAREALPVEQVHDIANEVLTREKEGRRRSSTATPSASPNCARRSSTGCWPPRVSMPGWSR